MVSDRRPSVGDSYVAGERVLSYQVKTATAVSNIESAFITVSPEIVPPNVALGQTGTFTEDGSAVGLLPNITVTSRDGSAPFLAAPDMLYGAEVDVMNWVAGPASCRPDS